jgi:pyruvate dehydrogenase E1 component alpha subunit/2-oxoisovalerate dehydrogenase E1 component alpha subunit
MTYRRKGHAEHDNQSYVPPGEIERWAAGNDPVDRYLKRLREEFGFPIAEIQAVDARVRAEVDRATDEAETSPAPAPLDALEGVLADPPREKPLWYRDRGAVVEAHERAAGWGTYEAEEEAADD